MILSEFILGAVILLFGKRLFWLFVAVMGFLFGIELAKETLITNSELIKLTLAILFGIFGAVFAIVFQWAAILLAGFLGGGYFLMNIFNFFVVEPEQLWFLFLLGGIVGLVLMALVFDFALILITSLVGAMLIAQNLNVDISSRNTLFFVIALAGVLVQYLITQIHTDAR